MRRTVRVLVVISALASAAWAAPLSPAGAAGAAAAAVVRDAQAGMHTLIAKGEQQQDTAIEPSISVNPADPANAVIGYQIGRIDAHCAQSVGYGVTHDAGQTWEWGALPKLTVANGGPAAVASDPVIAFGPNNTAYFSALSCSPHELYTSVSHDGGTTWADPIMIPSAQTFDDDKNWIAVDNGTGVGHHTGRVYVMADNGVALYVLYSDDEARTWNGPYPVPSGPGIGMMPMIMPNGDLSIVYASTHAVALRSDGNPETGAGSAMVITTSRGAGALPTGAPLAFTPPLSIASDRGKATPGHRAGDGIPTAAVNAVSGRIYVAWQDGRFRTDGLNDIVVTWSDDTGVTWTTPRPVNPGPRDNTVEHFTPAIGVGSDGSVRIAYRTQEQGTDYVDTAYQQSTDGGKTWSDPLGVNTGLIPEYLEQDPAQEVPVRTDVRFAAYSRGGAFLGDYSQVATTGSWTYVVRCEAYPTSEEEDLDGSGPSAGGVHHQRAWVAVVDADGDGTR